MEIDDQSAEVRGKGGDRSGGASIHVRDGRFSRLIGWAAVSVGGLFVSGLIWTANTLVSIKESLATMATTMVNQATVNTRLDAKNDQQDARLNQHDREIATLEGKALRGGPDAR